MHVLMNRPGGTHRQSPVENTTTLVGNVLSISSSALAAHRYNKAVMDGRLRSRYATQESTMCTCRSSSLSKICSESMHYASRFRLLTLSAINAYVYKGDVIHKTGSYITYRSAAREVPSHGHRQHALKIR